MSFIQCENNGLRYMSSTLISAKHAFTTRIGGVSSNGFSSLNLGFGRGDPAENVLENYRQLGAALELDCFSAAFTKQVHGVDVRTVDERDRCAPGEPAPCEADGLVTAVPGLPIFCFTADCVPVLLHDARHNVAAAVHCGWRSSVGDILGVTLERMCGLGAMPEDIRAAIGPAIGDCCFETDADVPQAVEAYLCGDVQGLILPGASPGKFMVDLRGANRRRLLRLGLVEENIDVSDECTKCSGDKYWSHRGVRGGERGSQCAVISL